MQLYTYFLSKELKDLECILEQNKNPKFPVILEFKIIHSTQVFRITQRLGVISEYFVNNKGFDYRSDVCKYIAKKINNNLGRKNDA